MCAKLALRPSRGVSRPRQFGPRMRSGCGRAASSIACLRAAPRPAVMTIAALVPSAPNAAISGGDGRRAVCRRPPGRVPAAGRRGVAKQATPSSDRVLRVERHRSRRRSGRRASSARPSRRRCRSAPMHRRRRSKRVREGDRGCEHSRHCIRSRRATDCEVTATTLDAPRRACRATAAASSLCPFQKARALTARP